MCVRPAGGVLKVYRHFVGATAVGLMLGLACTGQGDTVEVPPNPVLAADPLWDLQAPPSFRLTLPEADWEAALWAIVPTDDCESRQYAQGDLVFVNPVDGTEEAYEQVGVRWRGHSALDPAEYSRVGLKLSLNEFVPGRELHDQRKINLMGTEGDYSAMREHLALRIDRDMGIEAPRSAYAHLYVNDTYMGFYPMPEEADDGRFLENHFADPTGSLLKIEGYCGGRGDFADDGPDPLDYLQAYEPKGDTPDSAIEDHLFPLIDCVGVVADGDFEVCVQGLIDVENFLTEIAVDVALPDIDGMIGAGQNYMIYRRPDTGLFVIWPWDKDLALDEANLDPDWDLAGVHPPWASDFRNLLGDRLVRTFREDYCEIVLDVGERYDPVILLPELEEHRALIEPWIAADPWMDSERWGWITDDVVEVIRTRHPEVVSRAEACDF